MQAQGATIFRSPRCCRPAGMIKLGRLDGPALTFAFLPLGLCVLGRRPRTRRRRRTALLIVALALVALA